MKDRLTDIEYRFLAKGSEGLEARDIYPAGDACHAAGFIDDFGLITKAGRKAIFRYEKGKTG